MNKINRAHVGWLTSLDTPEAGWQKGATTTLLMDACPCLLQPFFLLAVVLTVQTSIV